MGSNMLLIWGVVVLFTLSVHIVTSQNDVCSGGFIEFNSQCYGFMEIHKSWYDAQNICHGLGAYLAEPQSQAEDIFLKGLATTHRETYVWIGAQDLLQEGKWFWAHSGLPVQGYTDWTLVNLTTNNQARIAWECGVLTATGTT